MWKPLALIFALSLTVSTHAAAQSGAPAAPPSPGPADGATAATGAVETLPWKLGPQDIDLGRGARLDLPEGFSFLGMPAAGELMAQMGNLHNDNLLGLAVSESEDDGWFVTYRFDEEGFVKDDEELDAAKILSSIQEGEEAYNEQRKSLGFQPIHADGWSETPRYEKGRHHVRWGLIVTAPDGASINQNTRILGRKGYLSVNLVGDRATIEAAAERARPLIEGAKYVEGARYEDFDSSIDRVAEYGLTGLVLGGTGIGLAKAAQAGLFAKFSKVILGILVAGKKGIVVVLFAVAAGAKRLFGRKEG